MLTVLSRFVSGMFCANVLNVCGYNEWTYSDIQSRTAVWNLFDAVDVFASQCVDFVLSTYMYSLRLAFIQIWLTVTSLTSLPINIWLRIEKNQTRCQLISSIHSHSFYILNEHKTSPCPFHSLTIKKRHWIEAKNKNNLSLLLKVFVQPNLLCTKIALVDKFFFELRIDDIFHANEDARINTDQPLSVSVSTRFSLFFYFFQPNLKYPTFFFLSHSTFLCS